MAMRHFVVCVETPEFFTQVYMSTGGVLEVHGNVTIEANTAGDDGGAVSLPFDTVLLLSAVVFCDGVCEGWSLRKLNKPRRGDGSASLSRITR